MQVRERAAARLAKFAGLKLDTIFWVNSGAEANENALKLAFRMTGRGKVVALEHGFHGRTAAAGAVTWGALEKWYGFPRTPFDVRFAPRDNLAAAQDCIDRDTAAVIVEPVQGLGGAYGVGASHARRAAPAALRRGGRVPDLRRSPARSRAQRRALRSQSLRGYAGHAHRREGARQRVPGIRRS